MHSSSQSILAISLSPYLLDAEQAGERALTAVVQLKFGRQQKREGRRKKTFAAECAAVKLLP
jgi:hypothetical protein